MVVTLLSREEYTNFFLIDIFGGTLNKSNDSKIFLL